MKTLVRILIFFTVATSYAQDDFKANSGVFAKEFDGISKLMLVIGAIVGLLAAIKVYNRWHIGEDDLFAGVSNLVLGALFLIVIGVALRAFFF